MRQMRGVRVDVAVLPTMVRILGHRGRPSGPSVGVDGSRHIEVIMTCGIL